MYAKIVIPVIIIVVIVINVISKLELAKKGKLEQEYTDFYDEKGNIKKLDETVLGKDAIKRK